MSKPLITQQRLKELLKYDEETGIFIWIKVEVKNQVKVFDVAGGVDENGYIKIYIDGRHYRAHRLVWLYLYGYFPKNKIDHFDGDRRNNSLENLRDATNTLNNQNKRKAHKNNHTGLLGVGFNKLKEKYHARIMVERKSIFLGYFDCKNAAHEAYLVAKRHYHEGCTL